jgi:hypothetical protein
MKVVTSVVNNPVFIEIQYYTLQQYMKCDYEFIVFNDAKPFDDFSNGGNSQMRDTITNVCKKLGIRCIIIPNNHHQSKTNRLYQEPSYRTAEAMNFILEFQKYNPDRYLLLDSDMFLIDNFYLKDYTNFDCSVVLHKRKNIDNSDIYYIWNGLYYFDIPKLDTQMMNWHCTYTTDTGGMMYKWLKTKMQHDHKHNHNNHNNHNNRIYFIRYLQSLNWNSNHLPTNIQRNSKLVDFLLHDPRNQNGQFFCEVYDNKFFHYRAGGNWDKKDMSLHIELSNQLKDALL